MINESSSRSRNPDDDGEFSKKKKKKKSAVYVFYEDDDVVSDRRRRRDGGDGESSKNSTTSTSSDIDDVASQMLGYILKHDPSSSKISKKFIISSHRLRVLNSILNLNRREHDQEKKDRMKNQVLAARLCVIMLSNWIKVRVFARTCCDSVCVCVCVCVIQF